MAGTLTLIPTPLDDDAPLEARALAALQQAAQNSNTLILAEESRPARRRWLNWGLPREAIERFINFNEHTAAKQTPLVLAALKQGQDAVLFSDTGMPAFCDPGTELVAYCHQAGLKVTAAYFPQSMVLAYTLAGFGGAFYFAGMLAGRSSAERQQHLRKLLARPEGIIFYDTPYRLAQVGRELTAVHCTRHLLVACDLATPRETLFWGKRVAEAWAQKEKREFVIVMAPQGFKLPPLPQEAR